MPSGTGRGARSARRRSALIANPFGFTRKLLGEKHSGQLSCPEEDINRHIRDVYSNCMREQDLGHSEALIYLNPAPCLTSMHPPRRKLKRSSNLPEWHQHQAQVEFCTRSSNSVPVCWSVFGRSSERSGKEGRYLSSGSTQREYEFPRMKTQRTSSSSEQSPS